MISHLNDDYDREYRICRVEKLEEMKKRKERQRIIRRMIRIASPILLCTIAIFIVTGVRRTIGNKNDFKATEESTTDNKISAKMGMEFEDTTNETGTDIVQSDSVPSDAVQKDTVQESELEKVSYSFQVTENTRQISEDIVSSCMILVDTDTNNIVAQKDAMKRINPASMTKILTLLVAAEHIDNLDDTFTITPDITDYGYINDCSNAGFEMNETVTVRDLLYGTILPSGADASVGLAVYVAGSQEKFVDLMNEKLKELGLSETAHFTNCVGVYDENHYCTAYDMAIILKAAVDNELCREVLSARTYTTSFSEQHPEGLTISNWFLRRIEDKDTGGEVICAKTGYVLQSGNCAASYGIENSGKGYICVTAAATSSWRCIYDHVALYKQFMS